MDRDQRKRHTKTLRGRVRPRCCIPIEHLSRATADSDPAWQYGSSTLAGIHRTGSDLILVGDKEIDPPRNIQSSNPPPNPALICWMCWPPKEPPHAYWT